MKIFKFFQFYSVIKDSSIEYLEKLLNYQPSSQPQTVVPDEPTALPEEPEISIVEPVTSPDRLNGRISPKDVTIEPAQAEDLIRNQSSNEENAVTVPNPSAEYWT